MNVKRHSFRFQFWRFQGCWKLCDRNQKQRAIILNVAQEDCEIKSNIKFRCTVSGDAIRLRYFSRVGEEEELWKVFVPLSLMVSGLQACQCQADPQSSLP